MEGLVVLGTTEAMYLSRAACEKLPIDREIVCSRFPYHKDCDQISHQICKSTCMRTSD